MPMAFSRRAAAKESSLSPRTIDAAIKDGRLKAFRVGRRVLVTPAALRRFLGEKKAGEVK
jgi:excisionase family DNA binding protein